MRALVIITFLSACTGSPREAADAALPADAALAADAPIDAPVDAAPPIDAPPDAASPDACVPGCHWDCFGGSQCASGFAWVNGFAPRPCCSYGDPWPGPGPVCSAFGVACAGGACATPDPRYAACTALIGTRAEPCSGGDCEHLLLHCPEGGAKDVGSPCSDDRDCRPAAEGVARLRCDTGASRCALDTRPPAPASYGESCGLTADQVAIFGTEGVTEVSDVCDLCHVHKADGECLRQACTVACTFDEDCPAGSICLCGSFGSPVSGYCAAATDRVTPAGRAAGLPACSPP
jgi:hypothetical protein